MRPTYRVVFIVDHRLLFGLFMSICTTNQVKNHHESSFPFAETNHGLFFIRPVQRGLGSAANQQFGTG